MGGSSAFAKLMSRIFRRRRSNKKNKKAERTRDKKSLERHQSFVEKASKVGDMLDELLQAHEESDSVPLARGEEAEEEKEKGTDPKEILDQILKCRWEKSDDAFEDARIGNVSHILCKLKQKLLDSAYVPLELQVESSGVRLVTHENNGANAPKGRKGVRLDGGGLKETDIIDSIDDSPDKLWHYEELRKLLEAKETIQVMVWRRREGVMDKAKMRCVDTLRLTLQAELANIKDE